MVGHGQDLVGVVVGADPEGALGTAEGPGQPQMARGLVGLGVDTNKIQAERNASLDDAHGDLAPVGHQDFMFLFRHGPSSFYPQGCRRGPRLAQVDAPLLNLQDQLVEPGFLARGQRPKATPARAPSGPDSRPPGPAARR
jgi:hypothetical protein